MPLFYFFLRLINHLNSALPKIFIKRIQTKMIFIFIFLYFTQCKVLMTNQQQHFSIQVGESYSESIPLLFNKFQHSKIMELKRQSPYYQKPICAIRPQQQGSIKQISSIEHTNRSKQNNIDNKIVYKFEDLMTFRVFIDAIEVQSIIVAIYATSQIAFYVMQQKNGVLHSYQKKKVFQQPIQYAKFVIVNGSLFLFTTKTALKIHLDGNYETVTGYKPVSEMFDDIKSSEDYVYIGIGGQGLLVYKYEFYTNSLSLVANTTFYIENNSSKTFFDVNQLHIDPTDVNNMLYILDRQQGLLAYYLNDAMMNGSTSNYKLKVLMGGCQHFIVTAFNIYLTCPELIILNKKGVVLDMKHNSFYPYQINLLGERIYMYGYRQLAIYDVFGTALQQHTLNTTAYRSFLLAGYIISFDDSAISTSVIAPQKEQLYCFTSSESKMGLYTGKYVTSGLCSQYILGPENGKEICQIIYPFKLSIKNSALVNYKIEIILILLWIILMAIVALIFTIRHHLIHKQYKQLVQEQTNENIQVIPQMAMKKGSNEEVN